MEESSPTRGTKRSGGVKWEIEPPAPRGKERKKKTPSVMYLREPNSIIVNIESSA